MRMESRVRPLAYLLLIAAPLVCAARGAGEKTSGAAGPAEASRIEAYRDPPVFTVRVANGDLRGARERLPTEPKVVTPRERIGVHGGTWRMALRETSLDSLWRAVMGAREISLDLDGQPVADLLLGYEVSPDDRVYTFHLRKGLKWSDGDTYDADDYLFAWQDVLLNGDLNPAKPAALVAGGRLARFDKIDPWTVSYTFAVPNTVLARRLAQPRARLTLVLPQHYLRAFHAKYARADDLEAKVQEGGYRDWIELFRAVAAPWSNPDLPVLDPWMRATLSEPGTVRLERNPYYWKVDSAGNQLPYLDSIVVSLCADVDACVEAAASGGVDLQIVDLGGPEHRARLDAGAGPAYRLGAVELMHANLHTVFFNRAAADPVLAGLFNDARFRRALSLAIDRDAINQEVHRGQASVGQVAPPAGSASYEPETALVYTEYDPRRANAMLDELGLTWNANHAFRVLPDTSPLSLPITYPTAWPPGQEDAMVRLREYWADIGIDLVLHPVERAAWFETVRGEDWVLSSYAVNVGGGPYLHLSSAGLFPIDSYWLPTPAWGVWLSSHATAGTEPPAPVKRLQALYEEYVTTATPGRAVEIEKEAFGLYARELLGIGIVSRPRDELSAVVSPRLVNLPPDPIPDDLSLGDPAAFFYAASDR
jgi:peptide/nickel transport system substrate-binding protein